MLASEVQRLRKIHRILLTKSILHEVTLAGDQQGNPQGLSVIYRNLSLQMRRPKPPQSN